MAIIRLIVSGFAILAVAGARSAEPVAEILTVQGTTIYPTNVAATVADVAGAVATAVSAAAKAEAVEQAAGMVSNAVAGVNTIVNSLEGIGYIRGYVLQFGSGIAADTNMTASIVKFAAAGTDGTNSLWDIWTYFSEDPGVLPQMRMTESLDRTNAWNKAEIVGTPAVEEVLAGGTLYEAYKIRVSMPPVYTSAFFRTFADIAGAGTNQVFMPVKNGVSVNGATPLTGTFTTGTNVFHFVGGVRVQ